MEFKPTFGKLLIRPLKEVKVSKKVIVEDDEKNKDKKPGETRETKKVTQRLPANFQLAKVLAVAKSDNPQITNMYEAGDIVVFRPNPAGYMSFDLVKDAYLIDNFLVVGKWASEENNEIM